MEEKIYKWNSAENSWVNVNDPGDTKSASQGIDIRTEGTYEYQGGTISGHYGDFRSVIADATGDGNPEILLKISDVKISNNSIQYDCGNAIRTQNDYDLTNHPTIIATNCIISSNVTYNWGGVVDNVGGNITLNGCMLINNSNSSEVADDKLGAAVSNRHGTCNMTITGCIFYNNHAETAGGALYNVNNGGGTSTSTITNSYFLTGGDNIFCQSGVITLSGTNYLGGSLTKESGTNTLSNGGSFVFINHDDEGGIEIKCDMAGNNTFVFNNKKVVDISEVTNISNVTSIVINPNGEVGEEINIAKGINDSGWDSTWSNTTSVEYHGDTMTIGESAGKVHLDSNNLYAYVTAKGLLMNKTVGNEYTSYLCKDITFVSGTYTEEMGNVVMGGDKTVTGKGVSGVDVTSLNGTIYADGHSLSMDNLKYSGTIYGSSEGLFLGRTTTTLLEDNSRIYAGGSFNTGGSFGGATTTVNTAVDGKARIYGACDVTTENGDITDSGNVTTTINVTGGTAVLYGGARVIGNSGSYTGSVTLGTISTTINGGSFTGYAGNGSQVAAGNVTQGKSTLTINNGSFDNVVYAGAYNQGTATVVAFGTELNINGGTFSKMVFGGCAANSNMQARNTKVDGNVSITVTGGTQGIVFARHLIAGSQSCMDSAYQVTGNATVTFKGDGSVISFASDSYVVGGSQLDGQKKVDSIGGTSTLAFEAFTASAFGACFDNTFDAVKFTGSSVTLTGAYVKLSKAIEWDFDVSDSIVDLNWISGVNDFAGDTINLKGWDGNSTCTFMTGSDATLNGFDSATVKVYTAAAPTEALVSGYTVSRSGNSLILAKA